MDKSPNLVDSKTATAPMLPTSEPAGSGMIPELVTAEWSRHEERHSPHDARVEREDQAGDAPSVINFLRLLGSGSIRSLRSEKDMRFAYITHTARHPRALGGVS